MRFLSCLLLLGVLVSLATSGWGASADGGAASKVPLDLPSGGNGADDEDEDEDAAEVISFFGEAIEGDGFFFCFSIFNPP